MKWYVGCKESFDERQKYIEQLIDEKHKQIEKLKFESSCLYFLLEQFKNNGWK